MSDVTRKVEKHLEVYIKQHFPSFGSCRVMVLPLQPIVVDDQSVTTEIENVILHEKRARRRAARLSKKVTHKQQQQNRKTTNDQSTTDQVSVEKPVKVKKARFQRKQLQRNPQCVTPPVPASETPSAPQRAIATDESADLTDFTIIQSEKTAETDSTVTRALDEVFGKSSSTHESSEDSRSVCSTTSESTTASSEPSTERRFSFRSLFGGKSKNDVKAVQTATKVEIISKPEDETTKDNINGSAVLPLPRKDVSCRGLRPLRVGVHGYCDDTLTVQYSTGRPHAITVHNICERTLRSERDRLFRDHAAFSADRKRKIPSRDEANLVAWLQEPCNPVIVKSKLQLSDIPPAMSVLFDAQAEHLHGEGKALRWLDIAKLKEAHRLICAITGADGFACKTFVALSYVMYSQHTLSDAEVACQIAIGC